MFRIVTDFVKAPTLLIVCDDRRCGCLATKTLAAGADEAARSAAVPPFIQEVMEQGWIREGRKLVMVPSVRLH